MSTSLANNAVLMRLSIGLPGEARQDNPLTEKVKTDHSMGAKSGKWVKALYPVEALKPIKEIDGQARKYHDSVTLPFDAGVGILPATLIMEYADKMRTFKGRRENQVHSHFLAKYQQWVDWAKVEHNGTFDPALYPGASEIAPKFYFKTEPLPVPSGTHFTNTVSTLLGTDVDTVNQKVAEAAKEAQKELLRRLMAPVKHMVTTLSKEDPRIFDSLVGNVQDILRIAPALNLGGDPVIADLIKTMSSLATVNANHLRDSANARAMAKVEAERVMGRLSGYAL